eukprot:1158623-Pelagomonas_calceolata.AAC.13
MWRWCLASTTIAAESKHQQATIRSRLWEKTWCGNMRDAMRIPCSCNRYFCSGTGPPTGLEMKGLGENMVCCNRYFRNGTGPPTGLEMKGLGENMVW